MSITAPLCLVSYEYKVLRSLYCKFKVYEKGMVYTPDVLDLTPEIIREHLLQTVRNIAAISLEIGRPTIASVPHSIANAVKGLIAIAVEANIELKEAEKV